MTYDIIILGSGPAGLAAAIAARGRDKSVLVIGNPWRDSPNRCNPWDRYFCASSARYPGARNLFSSCSG